MRVEDLNHQELLELDPEGGVIRFAGQRALLLDAVAMGLRGNISLKTLALPRPERCSPSLDLPTAGGWLRP